MPQAQQVLFFLVFFTVLRFPFGSQKYFLWLQAAIETQTKLSSLFGKAAAILPDNFTKLTYIKEIIRKFSNTDRCHTYIHTYTKNYLSTLYSKVGKYYDVFVLLFVNNKIIWYVNIFIAISLLRLNNQLIKSKCSRTYAIK